MCTGRLCSAGPTHHFGAVYAARIAITSARNAPCPVALRSRATAAMIRSPQPDPARQQRLLGQIVDTQLILRLHAPQGAICFLRREITIEELQQIPVTLFNRPSKVVLWADCLSKSEEPGFATHQLRERIAIVNDSVDARFDERFVSLCITPEFDDL